MTTRTFTKQNTFRATLTTNEDGTTTLVNSFRVVGTKDKWEDQTRTLRRPAQVENALAQLAEEGFVEQA
jgi:hypothetical protein